ncbi:MAG: D-glycerate dehydrogenase [Rhodothalassiaceae bacterium]
MDRPRVIVTRRLPRPIEQRMSELFDVRLNADDRPMDKTQMAAAVAEADILVPTVTDRIDAALLAKAGPRLKLIANFGNGVDHIDLKSAARRGITVTNTPGVLTEDTADMTFALILAAARRLREGLHMIEQGRWTGWAPTGLLGRRLAGKRLGIVGMGRIGTAVARRARAFGIEIHYHNRRRLPEAVETELGARYWESLDRMLSRMDIVTLHCPHTPATYHLLSARRLAMLPAHAIVINTARGEIVDENALIRMLEEGTLGGAGLDVFAGEPDVDPRLLALESVIALPHMGSATEEARIDMGEKVLINIKTFVDGHAPPDRILGEWL